MVTSRSSRVDIVEEVPIAELIEEKVVKPAQEIYIDQGLPIPEGYQIDTINALVQDPFHIWVYWELREHTVQRLKHIFPEQIAASFFPVLKITELKLGDTAFIGIAHRGNYWLSVFPDRQYRIEVGLRSQQRGYIRLLEAKQINTPRGTVSMEVSPEPQYQLSNKDFAEVLRISGFASFAGMLGPERILRLLPDQVADVISTIVTGEELSEEQLATLPPRIRALLLAMRARGGEGLTSLSLLHLMPEYLREALHETGETVADPLHPQHLAPRFMIGASEVLQKPDRQPWMPSMQKRPTSPVKSTPQTSADL
ncbi:MAG: DUF4912 domain-containing protein [Acidobacteriota bacterium]